MVRRDTVAFEIDRILESECETHRRRRLGMTLTKDKIVEDISNATDLKKYHATKAIEGILEIIKKTLVSGEDVLISGFGRFRVREKKARKGRNPQTGETLMLRPRKVVTFLCSSVLKDKINVKDKV